MTANFSFRNAERLELDYKPKHVEGTDKPQSAATEQHNFQLHKMLYGYYLYEREHQAANRFQMHTDEQFVDGQQWRKEDAQVLRERGQPALVFDQIGTPVYWMLGAEKQARKEFRVLPREANDAKRAQAKFQVMKFLDDINHTQFHQSKAFEDQVIAGLGWTELGYEDGQIFHRYQWWREMYSDSRDRTHDLDSARYVIRVKYVDLDAAINYFPECEQMLRTAASQSDSEEGQFYLGERLTNEVDGYDSVLDEEYQSVASRVYDQARIDTVKLIEVRYRIPRRGEPGKTDIRYALMVERAGGIIYDVENPYDHGGFGFVPRYCYRRKADNMPYGVVRKRRDAQEEYNKRRSKALHILNTNQIRMTKGAVEDKEELRQEAARPDGVIEYEQGHELELGVDRNLADEHLQLMALSKREIEEGMGVTDENMGRQGNATSGKAIISRQQQGITVQATIVDNHRMAAQIEGEITMQLIEQYMTEPKVIRIIGGPKSQADFVQVNSDPDTMLNETKADFILMPMDQTASARMAMAEQFLELAGRIAPTAPEEARALTAMAISVCDMPFAEQVIEYMREMYDFPDPTQELTDEQKQERKAQKAAQQQAQADQMKLAEDTIKLKNAETEAKVALLVQQAQKTIAETLDKKLEAFYSAMQAGLQLTLNPAIAPAADSMIRAPVEQASIDPAAVPDQPLAVMDARNSQTLPAGIDVQPDTPGVGQNAGMQVPEPQPPMENLNEQQ